MSDSTEIEARVQRGIAFLEEQVGPDWKSLVDVETLDLGDPETCVLGQVFAFEGEERRMTGYGYVRDYLLTGNDDAVDRGFDRIDSATESYDVLEAAWVRVLTEPEQEEQR